MANVFARQLDALLKRGGTEWTASIDGEPTTFWGILDVVESVETDSANQAVVMSNATLLVKTSVARSFGFKHELTDEEDRVWYCYETLKQDDGLLSKCVLVEKSPNDE